MPKYPYVARGAQANRIYQTQIFNIDNGSGTTVDDCGLYLDQAVEIIAVRAIYTEATDTTGAASANYKVGTTAGGAGIVAAFALEVSKAVGAAGTKATLVTTFVPASTTIFIRHTGIAATEAGQYKVQIEYRVKP